MARRCRHDDERGPRGLARFVFVVLVAAAAAWPRWGVAGEADAARAVAPAAPAGPANNAEGDGKKDEQEEDDDETFLRGADLQTDSEADSLLRRVHEYVTAEEPQYHKAAVVLQHLIDTAGNVLATQDHMVYHPVREQAERVLASLPAEGLAAYRAEVDGQAQALLGKAGSLRDEKTLHQVASRLFMSSRGDDAAFLLACLYLDQHQPLRARRVLLRLLAHHPDSSVPRAQVLLRLALACRRAGDAEGARAAWGKLDELRGGGLAPEAVAAVRREVLAAGAAARPPADRGKGAVRPTPRGEFDGMPLEQLERPRGLWLVGSQFEFDLTPPASNVRVVSVGRVIHTSASSQSSRGAVRDHLLARWEQGGWFPSGLLLFHDGLAYFKTHRSVVCLEPRTGKVRWEAKREEPKQKSTRRTSYSVTTFARGNMPASPFEAMLFGDRIGKALRILGDTVYHIDDHHLANWSQRRGQIIRIVQGRRVVQEPKKTPVGNRLVALDARTGKVRWGVGRTLDEKDPLHAVRFLAAPVSCGGRLLVAVETQGELSLAALDPADGRLVWRTFLCAYTSSMAAPWYEIGVGVEGSDVYVSSGQGVVLALDGIDGSVRWASRYERSFQQSTVPLPYRAGAVGWQGNHVFPLGGRVVVLPSDAEAVLAFDTVSGAMTARHAAAGMRYCLGLADGSLFVGSGSRVQRLALATGKPLWGLSLPAAGLGRGFLTRHALYVPSGKALLRVGLDSGKVETALRIVLPDDEPVGTVFGDGRAFVVYGLGRVYVLKSGSLEMAALDRRIAGLRPQLETKAGPSDDPAEHLAEAYLARARLHVGYERLEKALADYRTVLRKLPHTKASDGARKGLFRGLLRLAGQQAEGGAKWIREAQALARTPAERTEAARALAADHERRGEVAEAVASLLGVAQGDGPPGGGTASPIELEAERGVWRVRPDMLVAHDVRRLLAKHGERAARLLEQKSKAALDAARGKHDFVALQNVMRTYPGTPAAAAAGLAAARLEHTQGMPEKAELVLREMMATDHAPTAAAGLAALAAMHQQRGWRRQAHAEWQRLAKEFPDQPVPADGGTRKAGALAAAKLAAEPFAGKTPEPPKGLPEPPWKRLWDFSDGKTRYIHALSLAQAPTLGRRDASQFLEEHLFLVPRHKTSRLVCKRVRDGATVYETEMGTNRTPSLLNRDAHVAMWTDGRSTTVFGLVSGKPLWSHKAAAATGSRVRHIAVFRSGIAMSGSSRGSTSVLVQRQGGSTVRVLDLATGRLLWERSFRGTGVGFAQGGGRFVLLSAGRTQELWVCDALTGERLGTVRIEGRYVRTNLMTRYGLLCRSYALGRGTQTLVLHELPSGKARWTWDAKQHIRNLWPLDDSTLCVASIDGSIHIVDLATGAVRMTTKVGDIGRYVYSASLDATGKHLYLSGRSPTRKAIVAIFDLATGKKLRTLEYGSGTYFRPTQTNALVRSGRLLPIVVHDPPTKVGNRTRSSQLCRVKFFRRDDGTCLEDLKLPTKRDDGKFERLRSIHVQDGVLLVVLYTRVEAFGHAAPPAAPPTAKKQADAP